MRPASAAACASLAGCAHKAPVPPVELTVSGDERGCRFEAEGRLVARGRSPPAQSMLSQAARRWRGRPVIVVRGTADAPYKCFGLAVYVLQRQVDVGTSFVSKPLPDPD